MFGVNFFVRKCAQVYDNIMSTFNCFKPFQTSMARWTFFGPKKSLF